MRKLLSALLMVFAVLALASCGETAEEKNQKAFKDYLAANDALTVEEFDALASQFDDAELPVDLFTSAQIEKMHIAYTVEEDGYDDSADYYLWQNEKIYLAALSSDNEVAYYVDLNDLEAVYDSYREQLSTSVDVKPSEMVEQYIDMLLAEAYLDLDVDLATLLSAASFTIDDFEQVETNKFQLKNSALYAKIATASNGALTVETIEQELAASGSSMNIYVYFDGSHINGYEYSLSVTESGITTNSSMKLMLTFDGDNITGLSVKAIVPGTAEIDYTLNSVEDKLSFKLTITLFDDVDSLTGLPSPSVMIVEGSITNNNITISTQQDGTEIFNCNINFVNQKLGNVTVLGLNGSINMSYELSGMSIEITSGNDVEIPVEVLAMQNSAIDLMELLGDMDIQ